MRGGRGLGALAVKAGNPEQSGFQGREVCCLQLCSSVLLRSDCHRPISLVCLVTRRLELSDPTRTLGLTGPQERRESADFGL